MGGNLAHFRAGINNPVVWKRLKEQNRTHLLEHKFQKDKDFLFDLFTAELMN